MRRLRGAGLFRELERLIDPGTVAGLTESELVARFVDRRDPVAFEAIVSRHGPMVLSLCRVMLADANDVDDAFQATFAILIEKARRLRRPERLGPWLHGVAFRVAHRARTRRRGWSIPDDLESRSSEDVLEQQEQLAALHDEIERLPEKYRLPVVLCCLEEQSGEEAARRLGWPVGTVHGRLSRARDMLRDRLSRHKHLAPSSVAFGLHLLDAPRAVVPEDLLLATLKLLRGTLPHRLQSLVAGVLSAMLFEKTTTLGMVSIATLSVVSTMTFLVAFQPPSAGLGAQVAPTSSRTSKSSLAQADTKKADIKSARRTRPDLARNEPPAQQKADEESVVQSAARLQGELELLELESTIYRDAIKSTKDFIVGADVEKLESEMNDPASNPSTKKSAEVSLSNVRSSAASIEKLKKEYLHTREQIATVKSKIAREAGQGRLPGRDVTRDSGPAQSHEETVAHVVGQMRGELDLLELENEYFRAAIKQSMSRIDAWSERGSLNESAMSPEAREKVERNRNELLKREAEKLARMKDRYVKTRERIALLKSKIARIGINELARRGRDWRLKVCD